MKKALFLLTILFVFSISFAQKVKYKAGTIVRQQVQSDTDSVVFYDSDIDTKQQSYMNLLTGSWSVTTMHRQARMPVENLANIKLTLKADSTFEGTIGCSTIQGLMSVKGTSIKFKSVHATPDNCTLSDQQTWILKLLTQTVSAYSVSDASLLLRDGSSNIVFDAVRNQ